MKTQTLARDSLKTSKMFTVLYNFMLYVTLPIAFEMSYVKIFQRSMGAYHVNDMDAMSRLIVYFGIQWFLGVLVRRNYLKSTLKRITLTLLILLQLKEAFFEEVVVDMVISMIIESGFTALLFFQFSNIVVLLKIAGLCWLIVASLFFVMRNGSYFEKLRHNIAFLFDKNNGMSMYRIHNCRIQHIWNRPHC